MTVTSIRLQAELEEPLEVLAKKLDRSKNYLINQALKEFIAQQELAGNPARVGVRQGWANDSCRQGFRVDA